MFQIQVSKRRQKFVTLYRFDSRETAEFWLRAIQVPAGARKRLRPAD